MGVGAILWLILLLLTIIDRSKCSTFQRSTFNSRGIRVVVLPVKVLRCPGGLLSSSGATFGLLAWGGGGEFFCLRIDLSFSITPIPRRSSGLLMTLARFSYLPYSALSTFPRALHDAARVMVRNLQISVRIIQCSIAILMGARQRLAMMAFPLRAVIRPVQH